MFYNVNDCINFIESRKRNDRSLDNMYRICEAYGNPQDHTKFIHVAGTNGKGSIVSYMKYILCENEALSIGTFTSPYIECFNERIQINGIFISDTDIIYYTNLIVSKFDDLTYAGIEEPGFFAFCTLMCFLYFKDKKVDVAIIEVGIGGLLDCTNVINPILAIISNVNYDHMNLLGNTLKEIGSQKLGIVKRSVPLVTIENNEINDLIIETCKRNNSELRLVQKNDIEVVKSNLKETVFNYKEYLNIHLSMLGEYQAENASIAIEACKALKQLGWEIDEADIYNGLEQTIWLGRLEVMQENPIIIFDGAHNIDGINRLYDFLVNLKEIYPNKLLRIVIAISANKEKFKMIEKIETIADKIVFTTFNYKRSEDGKVLYLASNNPNKEFANNVSEILENVIDGSDEYINCFAGSLYFISELRKIYFSMTK